MATQEFSLQQLQPFLEGNPGRGTLRVQVSTARGAFPVNRAVVEVAVSPQFYGWLAGLGTGAAIVSPENIRRDYISFLKKTLKNYGENSI